MLRSRVTIPYNSSIPLYHLSILPLSNVPQTNQMKFICARRISNPRPSDCESSLPTLLKSAPLNLRLPNTFTWIWSLLWRGPINGAPCTTWLRHWLHAIMSRMPALPSSGHVTALNVNVTGGISQGTPRGVVGSNKANTSRTARPTKYSIGF